MAIESRDTLPTPDNLRTKIIEEYDARKNSTSSNSNQGAMYVRKKQQPKNDHNVTEVYDRQKKFKFKCFRCHQTGHKQSQCSLKGGNSNNSASVALSSTEMRSVLCQNVNNVTASDWCLDSGCTSHLCRDLNR